MCVGNGERKRKIVGWIYFRAGAVLILNFISQQQKRFRLISHMVSHFMYIYVCDCDCDVICREWVELNFVKTKNNKSWGWKFFLLHQLSVQLTSMRNSISKEFPCCQLIKLPFYALLHSSAVGVNYFRLCNSVRCTWEFLSFKIWFDTQTYTWDMSDMNMWMWVNESSETPNKNALKNYHQSHLTIDKQSFVWINFVINSLHTSKIAE